jgi:hypothetical protein
MRWVDGFEPMGEVVQEDWAIWRGWGLEGLKDLLGRLTFRGRPVTGPDWPEIVQEAAAAARQSRKRAAVAAWYAWGGAYEFSVACFRRTGFGWSIAACRSACGEDRSPDRAVIYAPWSPVTCNPAFDVLARAHTRRVEALLRRLGWEGQPGRGAALGLWSIWREGPVLLGRVDISRMGAKDPGLEGFIYIPGLGIIERGARDMLRYPSPIADWLMELGMSPRDAKRAARAIKHARRPEVAVKYALAALSS